MLIDARSLSEGSEVRAEAIVVGSGPAGIMLGLELARAGHDVVLVESGGPRRSGAAQELGETPYFDPHVHAPMSLATNRQLGGASVTWGGRCLPFDPVDFDRRPWIPYSEWPVRYEDLLPYFPRACEWFVCGQAEFDLRRIPGIEPPSLVPGLPDGDVTTSIVERWSLPTNFGKEYGRELSRSERIRVFHGLTCVEIVPDASLRRIEFLRARTLDGREVTLRGSAYVLACGGLETTRLLLASGRGATGGLGNSGGWLGRFYMGHVSGRVARIRFSTPPDRTVYAFDRDPDGVYLRRRFSFAREFQHEHRMTNVVMWLVNPEIRDPSHGSGVLSFAYLALTSPGFGRWFAPEALRRSAAGDLEKRIVWPHVGNVLRDLPATLAFVPTFGWKRFVPRRRVPGFFVPSASNTFLLHYHGEQVPNPESRVVLSNEADRLGLRKLKIDLRFTPQDVDGIVRAHDYLDGYLRRHGVGSLAYLSPDVPALVWDQASDGYHQAGTTRMSVRPQDGVVDPDSAVHGFRDLFVASSSIFPTSGQANSTFMILVFALRLADHLREKVLRKAP